jgi:hypothetical protein
VGREDGPATVLDIEVRPPATRHAISRQQVERWLAGATSNPNETVKKAKLKATQTIAASWSSSAQNRQNFHRHDRVFRSLLC